MSQQTQPAACVLQDTAHTAWVNTDTFQLLRLMVSTVRVSVDTGKAGTWYRVGQAVGTGVGGGTLEVGIALAMLSCTF